MPVEPGHFPAITTLLQSRFAQANSASSDWSRVFRYSWRRPEDPIGFIALESEQVLGFIGTVVSYQPDSTGEVRRFCNLTSWTAVPESRTAGALLMREALSLRDCTFTNLTSAPQLVQPMLKLGFKVVDFAAVIIPLSSAWRPEYQRVASRIVSEPEQVRAILNGPSLQAFIDHQHLPCQQLAMCSQYGTCHLIYNFRRGKLFNYAHIQHISRQDILVADLRGLLTHLFLKRRIARLVVEPRWLSGGLPPGTKPLKLHSPRLLRGNLPSSEAGNGYSEMVLLNLV